MRSPKGFPKGIYRSVPYGDTVNIYPFRRREASPFRGTPSDIASHIVPLWYHGIPLGTSCLTVRPHYLPSSTSTAKAASGSSNTATAKTARTFQAFGVS